MLGDHISIFNHLQFRWRKKIYRNYFLIVSFLKGCKIASILHIRTNTVFATTAQFILHCKKTAKLAAMAVDTSSIFGLAEHYAYIYMATFKQTHVSTAIAAYQTFS